MVSLKIQVVYSQVCCLSCEWILQISSVFFIFILQTIVLNDQYRYWLNIYIGLKLDSIYIQFMLFILSIHGNMIQSSWLFIMLLHYSYYHSLIGSGKHCVCMCLNNLWIILFFYYSNFQSKITQCRCYGHLFSWYLWCHSWRKQMSCMSTIIIDKISGIENTYHEFCSIYYRLVLLSSLSISNDFIDGINYISQWNCFTRIIHIWIWSIFISINNLLYGCILGCGMIFLFLFILYFSYSFCSLNSNSSSSLLI